MFQSLKKFKIAKFILNILNSKFVLNVSKIRIKYFINLSKKITTFVKKNFVIDANFWRLIKRFVFFSKSMSFESNLFSSKKIFFLKKRKTTFCCRISKFNIFYSIYINCRKLRAMLINTTKTFFWWKILRLFHLRIKRNTITIFERKIFCVWSKFVFSTMKT